MTEECDGRRISSDSSMRLGDYRCSLLNGILKLAATVVPVDSHAEVVAGSDVARFSRTNLITRRRLLDRSQHARKRFAHDETEFGIEGERAVVVRSLHETDSRELLLGCA